MSELRAAKRRPPRVADCLAVGLCLVAAARNVTAEPAWTFAVSGDSRNCGDVVMPAIAAGVHGKNAAFYWHLGDLRVMQDFDEDFRALYPNATIGEYLATAWLDFQRSQIEPFAPTPFFVGIGNHELVPPKTREEFIVTFADWLDAAPIHEQRLRDDPRDHAVRAYYHWTRDGIDFISLDNASPEQFDDAQIKWLQTVLANDREDSSIRAVVAGMHEALPESRARGHSMSDRPNPEATGLAAYSLLLELQKTKPVYVLASHSHFVMDGIFDTPYWREHGGVLPGWIIGTAGAVRYALPPDVGVAKIARTHVYGYLLATVAPAAAHASDPIRFNFNEVSAAAVPAEVVRRFGSDFVQRCFRDNPPP